MWRQLPAAGLPPSLYLLHRACNLLRGRRPQGGKAGQSKLLGSHGSPAGPLLQAKIERRPSPGPVSRRRRTLGTRQVGLL